MFNHASRLMDVGTHPRIALMRQSAIYTTYSTEMYRRRERERERTLATLALGIRTSLEVFDSPPPRKLDQKMVCY